MKREFVNPIYGGQDPFVCKGPDGRYYGVAESADSRQIEVFDSDRLTDRGVRRVVYQAAESGPSSADLWAPELWYLRGKWYIYYAGASAPGTSSWETHRMYVLEADTPLGPYRFAGPLDLGEYMSIDGTVMELPDGGLIFFYMRKYRGVNTIFMAPMSSPTRISGEPVLLSKPDHPWEADINEGPFPIVRKGRVSLMYAANAAHLPQYCLALIHCTDPGRILDPSVWVKEPEPILAGQGDVIGPGHACIVSSPDGREDYLLFHSKFDRDCTLPGGWNRVVNLLKMTWNEQQRPVFDPLPAMGEPRRLPSGERSLPEGGRLSLELGTASDHLAEFGYYRSQTIFYEPEGLRIRGTACPEYGDKVMLRDGLWKDFEAEVELEPLAGECGVLFRVQLPAARQYLWHGCGLYISGGTWRLVRCNGKRLAELAQGEITGGSQMVVNVYARGRELRLRLNGAEVCNVTTDWNDWGQIGFGTLNGEGRFVRMSVRPLDQNSVQPRNRRIFP